MPNPGVDRLGSRRYGPPAARFGVVILANAHDPEKWEPIFG
jgi:hypothetical protein